MPLISVDSDLSNILHQVELLMHGIFFEMKVTPKGQVTIPVEIRRKLGIEHHDEVNFVLEGERVFLEKAQSVNSVDQPNIRLVRGILNMHGDS